MLRAGHTVSNYDIRQSVRFPEFTTIADVRDGKSLAQAAHGMDAIVHLAAEHTDNVRPVSLYCDVNVNGAKRVAEAATGNGIGRIIFTSSVALYGLDAGIPDETSLAKPFNEYGRSKHLAEEVFQDWAGQDLSRSLVIVRPCVIFGEGNRGNVHTLLAQIRSGKFFVIGDAKNKKSMAYIENVTQFLVRTLQFGAGQHVFNYADKPDLATEELITVACCAFGRKLPPRIPLFVGLSGGYIFDLLALVTGKKFPVSAVRVRKFLANTQIGTKRLEELGWEPAFTLKDGLSRMIAHDFPATPMAPKYAPAAGVADRA